MIEMAGGEKGLNEESGKGRRKTAQHKEDMADERNIELNDQGDQDKENEDIVIIEKIPDFFFQERPYFYDTAL